MREDTMRDRFAMAALTGLLANPEALRIMIETYHQGYENAESIMQIGAPRWAYETADEMLKARTEVMGVFKP